MYPGNSYRKGQRGGREGNRGSQPYNGGGGDGAGPPPFAVGDESADRGGARDSSGRQRGRGGVNPRGDGYGRGRGNRGGYGGDARGRGRFPGANHYLNPTAGFPSAAAAHMHGDAANHGPGGPLPDHHSMPSENDVSTWRQKDFHALVKAFAENEESQELVFPATLTPTQRNNVHRIAMVFGLEHKSFGVAPNRHLKLTKMSGTVAIQKLKETAMIKGERVKTIDGFQGAQLLPDRFIDRMKVAELAKSLQQHKANMLREIKLEANRPTAGGKKYQASQPGLSQVPAYRRDEKRFQDLQRFRTGLPAYKRGKEIIEAVRNNDVVIISGDTGCGKTTQIPQLLYDAGIFPKESDVICTQPRRISALSVANRVAEERGEACGDSCGYVIRFENVTSWRSHIVYQTTGILLRRLHSEPELHGVACVVVDEVHERDLDTDFCLLLLRDRLEAQRKTPGKFPQKLKLVVMSATVQIESLVRYFSESNGGRPAPLISIPGTLFPVSEFFLEDAIAWVGDSKSGSKALAFLTNKASAAETADTEGMTLYEKLRSSVFNDQDRDAEAMVPYELLSKLIVCIHRGSRDLSGSILVFLPGWAAITRIADTLRRSEVARELSVLMLHSNLTSAEQQRVFLPPPKRYRKVVLATSIAETSITIDDVVYVIDSGLIKGTSYDPSGNTSALQATLIAKANGIQRRGRAGRCREGVCVHLLPRSVYNNLPEFLPPEIMRSPLEEICLQVKAIRSDERCASVLARAMDPPPANSVEHAVTFLTEMGALTEEEELLTNLGRALAQLPLHPLLGKMLFAAAIFGVLDSVATIAAGLSVKSPFVKPMNHQRAASRESLQRIDNGDLSDHLCVLKLYRDWVRSGRGVQFANEHFADHSTLRSLERTKTQLVRLVQHSPMLRRWKDPLREASKNDDNMGLIRLTMLWSLYPRIATLEYRRNRKENRVNVFCWDNKPATFSMSSALALCKRNNFGTNTFVVYYERMQLESMLNLFDSSLLSAVDVALCVRQLIVRPLQKIPAFLLKDEDSKLGPPVELDVSELEDHEKYSGLFFDGDKKLYIAENAVANLLETGRQCMDYYLALCIKKLRADAFPPDLVSCIAAIIGFPLDNRQAAASPSGIGSVAPEQVSTAEAWQTQSNAPAFVRGGQTSGDSSDEDADGPIIVDDDEVAEELHLTEDQLRKVTAAFGDLAVFRRAEVLGLDTAVASAAGEAEGTTKGTGHRGDDGDVPALKSAGRVDDDDQDDDADDSDEDDDVIVAAAGELVM